MKKLFVLFIALALLVGVSSEALAVTTAYTGGTGMGTLRMVTITNAAGGLTVSTSVSTSYIIPGKCLLLGYDVTILTPTNYEGLVSIRDAVAATDSDTDNYIINESEATPSVPVAKIFPGNGLNISRGVKVNQGAQTSVTLYYIQVIP